MKNTVGARGIVPVQPFPEFPEIPLNSPFSKGEILFSSLCQREAGRDFATAKQFQKVIY
jgi:hypothetical protein